MNTAAVGEVNKSYITFGKIFNWKLSPSPENSPVWPHENHLSLLQPQVHSFGPLTIRTIIGRGVVVEKIKF